MIDSHIFQDKKAVYFTLGCKLNFAETSTLGKYLAEQGIRKAQAGEQADICIVNTCSVTELADKKCRQAIRRIKKQHPQALMIVTGCYAQLKSEEVSNIEGVDLVFGANQKMEVVDYLLNNPTNKTHVIPMKDIANFIPSCSQDDRTRHFLKVQDGCDYYCSYCTIPFARGRSRNGAIAGLVQMADTAGHEGGKEIVLTGVNIGDFGKTTGETFFDLIKALDRVESIERFRISSIEPNLLTDEILDFVAHSQRFAPHFHIPLQSGSDTVLKLMRRRYDTAFFRSKIEKIKALLPDAFIGIDVIVGMRGETAELFQETLHFLETLPFAQLHVFSYSERPGTMALKIEPIVSSQEKQERSKQLLALSEQKLNDFYRSQRGTTHKVLLEHTKKNNKMYGFTGNYIKVAVDYNPDWVNKLIDIRI
ncbi:MAG: Threonylcarbamoyladenosine tRNA methylthiotransferase MtaB [Candidatus Ordinivivax streblomastigis]|uniref:Threonylcarbamoyladenosine tRNA methylthiotransferase MtaB n=1 Tax=Candidatus Ordinivivax streblomastigis TaxID=2540710 RepID=A0A5M8P4S7_9BACT|nr:MAG: Threonylcarbamoyladenosine tRNA methylthiotransferase MtaB [Candidatus Ordinivivax streblomastigis]